MLNNYYYINNVQKPNYCTFECTIKLLIKYVAYMLQKYY